MTIERAPENCPTCNGWVLVEPGVWVRSRDTVGMICPTCKKDYSISEEE